MSKARYDDHVEISARFDSTGTCGHQIKKGDRIGWARQFRETRCAVCWESWAGENQAADFDEMQYASQF